MQIQPRELTSKASQHNSKVVTFLHINNVFFLSHIPMSITSMKKKNGLWHNC